MSRVCAFGPFAELSAYAAAVAGLSVSSGLTDDVRGAVAVVPGAGDWWQGMLAARSRGASAVVLADPGVLPHSTIDRGQWDGGIPVIVERPRLRPDVVADAVRARRGSPARLVTVECAAPATGLSGVILDGVGWVRSLAGAPLAPRAAAATVNGRMALLEFEGADGAVPATVVGTPLGGLQAGGLLQVLALGEVRTEITVDEPAGLSRVETLAEEGAFRSPPRYESSARLALRHAITACSSGDPTGDLQGLLEDSALTRALLDFPAVSCKPVV